MGQTVQSFLLTCLLELFLFELSKLVEVVSILAGEVKHSPRLFTTVQAETSGGLKDFSKILEYDAVVIRENLWEGLDWVPFGGLTFRWGFGRILAFFDGIF